jgi:hypothetical protein
MTEREIRIKAIEIAVGIAQLYQDSKKTRKSFDGEEEFQPADPRFLFGTAKQVAEYIRGNFDMNYFLPKDYNGEPDKQQEGE